jgi:hypothetical protein
LAGGVCCGGVCAASETPIAQKQTGAINRRTRLKDFIEAYLSTLRFFQDNDKRSTVSRGTADLKAIKALF